MQKITVEILAKGYTGLNTENIEKALSHYFGSPTLGVSFSVTEAAQEKVMGLTNEQQIAADWLAWLNYRVEGLPKVYDEARDSLAKLLSAPQGVQSDGALCTCLHPGQLTEDFICQKCRLPFLHPATKA